jgi:AcrR family transcriptional regulator
MRGDAGLLLLLITIPSGRYSYSMTRRPTQTRERLIEAANRVALRDGVGHLTLEAVAAEAGISKGGMLYHFRSKESLLAAMVDRFVCNIEQELDRSTQSMPGSWMRAYISASIQGDEHEHSPSAALIAAVATNPVLLEPIRDHYVAWQQRVEADGLDPALATIVRLAADGLWIADLLGLASPRGELRRRVIEGLIGLTYSIGDVRG